MTPIDLIEKYYDRNARAYSIVVTHGRQVAGKALKAAEKVSHLEPDLELVEKAAMLHDIGIFLTDTPQLGCKGIHPYIRHGVLGHDLLMEAGCPKSALVCERHVGVGISIDDIRNFKLPLPQREMVPISIEEQIVCYADKFYSKNGNGNLKNPEKTVGEIITSLEKYGPDKVGRFKKWVEMFGG